MDIVEVARRLLENTGYETCLSSWNGEQEQFTFEDMNIFGSLTIFETTAEMVRRWQMVQDDFIQSHSLRLSEVPEKAWNIYSVLLTAEECPPDLMQAVNSIEEDFRSTRKIARCGVQGPEAVESALVALLPMRASHAFETADLGERLKKDVEVDETIRRLVEADDDPKSIADKLLRLTDEN